MPRDQHRLYIGIYNSVLALDARDGTEIWRTKLGGVSFVNVYWDGEQLFATSKGEAFALDPRSGQVVWHNKLKGLGMGLVTLASTRVPGSAMQVVNAEAERQARSRRESAAAT